MIVIDTHVWIWWANRQPRLRQAVRDRLDAETDVRVSAFSLVEIAIASSLGRLSLRPTPREWVEAAKSIGQVKVEPLTAAVCFASVSLPGSFHRDPGDRLIVALARELDAELATADDKILRYDGVRTLRADWRVPPDSVVIEVRPMNIAFFASSLVSAYWNGAATYYRGIVRAMAKRGHRVTFYESDAYDRQAHRDMADPPWATVVVYDHRGTDPVRRCLDAARGADLIVKASGNGVHDELLEAAVLDLKRPGNRVCFWDVDAPATLERVDASEADPFRPLVPRYDLILTYGGGQPVVDAYGKLGARRCVPIYNALDPETHHPVEPDDRFAADLGFLGNRLPDREARVERFFLAAAARSPDNRFLIGGNGWHDKPMPANVTDVGHVYTRDHNAFNCTPRAVLNVNRESMARFGFSPATRVFEAAGAGACLITDAFVGVERFFEPGTEILVAADGEAVAEHVRGLSAERARAIGEGFRRRALAEHTYDHRAALLDDVLAGG